MVASHFFELEVDTADVINVVNSAESLVASPFSDSVNPAAFFETMSLIAVKKLSI